jgi:hypothetical protein
MIPGKSHSQTDCNKMAQMKTGIAKLCSHILERWQYLVNQGTSWFSEHHNIKWLEAISFSCFYPRANHVFR